MNQQQFRHKAIKFFEQSFETFYDHAIAVDAESRVTWISEAYYHFLQLKKSPIGRPVTEIIPNSFIPSVVRSGQPVFLDMLHVNGQWVVVSAFPLKDEDGEVIGAFGFVAIDQMKRIQPLLKKYSSLQSKLKQTQAELQRSRRARYTLSQCIGVSEPIREVKRQIRQSAGFDLAVLLLGETGTGKELFAHALHNLSYRSDGPFISVNVAAVPDSLLEAEFFGVSPGAYTGADRKGRPGKFKLADGGTLFLDEIGDMPLEMQAKLLRALQEKEIERIGSNTLESVDVRIVAATSKDLPRMVKEGQFRADLFYRLNSFPIHLPPLRARREDIEGLCEKMIEEIAIAQNSHQHEITPQAMQRLRQYDWPGNVRELKNIIEQACVMSDDSSIDESLIHQLLPGQPIRHNEPPEAYGQPENSDIDASMTLAEIMQKAERHAIRTALRRQNNHKIKTARALGISRASLYEKINRLGL